MDISDYYSQSYPFKKANNFENKMQYFSFKEIYNFKSYRNTRHVGI